MTVGSYRTATFATIQAGVNATPTGGTVVRQINFRFFISTPFKIALLEPCYNSNSRGFCKHHILMLTFENS